MSAPTRVLTVLRSVTAVGVSVVCALLFALTGSVTDEGTAALAVLMIEPLTAVGSIVAVTVYVIVPLLKMFAV
jgi:hypothetical protein